MVVMNSELKVGLQAHFAFNILFHFLLTMDFAATIIRSCRVANAKQVFIIERIATFSWPTMSGGGENAYSLSCYL